MPKLEPHGHRLVMSVAVNAAYELYETLMANNQMYEAWKSQHPGASQKGLALAFVKEYTPRCIGIARATLARMLEEPTINPAYKEEIMDALILDATLMKGRVAPAEIIGSTTGEQSNG